MTKRLFVDMDGTLAVFKPAMKIEDLYEPGYFRDLEPIHNVVNAVREIISSQPDTEVFVLSAVLSDSKFALKEKNEWLDKYLPEIDASHRYFPPCGTDKKDCIPNGVSETDYLLDDYTKNLTLWCPPGEGIKLLNGINHTNGTWQGNRLSFEASPAQLAKNITAVMSGSKMQDTAPQLKRQQAFNDSDCARLAAAAKDRKQLQTTAPTVHHPLDVER